ncbi:hypothetical protein P3W45_000198 [Vairimorpha bombi]|jgi:hypothetical protein
MINVLHILIFIHTIQALGYILGDVSKIAFSVPSFSSEPINIFYRLFYGAWLVLFIFFMFMRKTLFIGLQKQAVILQGMYFGVDLSVYTATGGVSSSLPWLIALISAPTAALLSVNDKFKNIFISMINAFAISYLTCVIIRIESILKIALIGIIAYFIIIVLISGSERFQLCFAKIFTVTIAIISLIDLTGLVSIFLGLHGLSLTNTMAFIYYFVAALIMMLIGFYFISTTYFDSWLDEKVEEVQSSITSEAPVETT